jgi:hypothetical protein
MVSSARSVLRARKTPFKRKPATMRIAISEYDIFKHVASQAPYFRWIIGHGSTTNTDTRVPPGTWVVFLSKPGHSLNFFPFIHNTFRSQILQKTSVTRKLALDEIPPGRLPALTLLPSSWRSQIYGPNDLMPNTYIELFDRTPLTNMDSYRKHRLFNSINGVTKTSTNFSFPTNKGETTTVKNLVLQHGKGIYFVVACRGTSGQSPSSLNRSGRQNSTSARGGLQLVTPATNTSGRTARIRTMNISRTRRQGTLQRLTSIRRPR